MPPTLLIDSLNGLRRRIRLLGLAFGAGLVVCAGMALLLTISGLDYLLNLPAIPRVILLTGAAVVLAGALFVYILRPLLSELQLSDIAARLEQTFPQLQDRLRSALDIMAGRVPGSDAMKQRILTETTTLATRLDFSQAVRVRPVWYATGAGAGSLVLMLLLALMVGSQYSRIALARLMLPFGEHPWPKVVQIDVVGSLPERLAVGQRVDVNIRLAKGDRASRRTTVFYRYGDESGNNPGPEQQEYMTRGDDGVYHVSIDARLLSDTATAGTLKIRMEAGDDQLLLPAVKVVQRLALKSASAVITPPPYANQPAVTVNLSQGPAVATVGSTVRLAAQFSKPLNPDASPTIESVGETKIPPLSWQRPDDHTLITQFTVTDSMRFHLQATDLDEFQNTAGEEFEIVARPDQLPTVQIENPSHNEDRTANAVIPVQVMAEDDFGINSAALVVDHIGDKKHWEIPLVKNAAAVGDATWLKLDGAGNLQRYRANYSWDLAKLADASLKPGDVLDFFAAVQDNFSLNGQTHLAVSSSHVRITIISQDDLTAKITEQLRTLGEQIGQVKADQSRTQRQTNTLEQQSQSKPQFDDADRVATQRLANQESTHASQARQLAGKLDDVQRELEENQSPNTELKETAKDVQQLLSSTAENPMKQSVAALAQAPQMGDVAQRNQQMQLAQQTQEQAVDQLQKALDRMGSIGSLSRTIDQIKALLADQQKISAETQAIGKNNLGKRPEEMSGSDRQKLLANAKEQSDLAARTAKALGDMQKTAEQLTKSDSISAAAMKEAAATGQQQSIAPNQQKAAAAAGQNQQSQAQSAQKQAELGLQMMLNSLNEAERRKLEELTKKLEELQQQLANLVRRQAGHNLDDLNLQGPAAVAALETQQRQDLFSDAERDAKDAPPAVDLGMLSGAQEQTEANTRDIAKTAADLPDGAGAADHLTDAADQMERAIVSLRGSKLAEAFVPQTEALADLHAAKKIIDDQKAAADQKKQQQQKEAIRMVYMQLKQQQDKLNASTLLIDSAPRAEDGSLHREEAIRLGQLPGEQGAMADRVTKLDDDLSALGSVVYIWANNDIARTMREVKDDLGNSQTGVPTQAEQKRISAQLDAMIRDLATKPIESKFAQKGGGGGQCSPGLPSEAELRLLKDLQVAVNDSTKEMAAQPKLDKPKLLALGGRQGEMRGLLDQMLQKSSQGQMKLGPEPDNRDQLPEEADKEQIENQELDTQLLNDKPGAQVVQKDMNLVGDRMARARQRLAINSDPGSVTQAIQEKILSNLDDMIEMARKKEAQTTGQPDSKQKPQQAMGPPKPNAGVQPQGGQPKPNSGVAKAGSNPAGDSYKGGANTAPDLAEDIHQKMTEWGGVTPRQRQAVIEGAGEQVIDKYKTLVDDYYRSLATKSDEPK